MQTSIEAMIDPGPLESAERTTALIEAAERAGEAGDRDLHIELLWLVAVRTTWTDPGEAIRGALGDAARRLGNAKDDDPRVVAIYAYAHPFGHAPEVVARLREVLAHGGHDPEPGPAVRRRRIHHRRVRTRPVVLADGGRRPQE